MRGDDAAPWTMLAPFLRRKWFAASSRRRVVPDFLFLVRDLGPVAFFVLVVISGMFRSRRILSPCR